MCPSPVHVEAVQEDEEAVEDGVVRLDGVGHAQQLGALLRGRKGRGRQRAGVGRRAQGRGACNITIAMCIRQQRVVQEVLPLTTDSNSVL